MRILSTTLLGLASLAGCVLHEEQVTPPMPGPSFRRIERFDPRMDKLIPKNAEIEVLGDGFTWTEGVVWLPTEKCILFSDIPSNRVMKWKEGQGMSLYLKPSGYTGDVPRGGEPGSNALTLDPQGRLILCQHGDRRVVRMDAPLNAPAPRFLNLADRYDRKRLNSPNDLVYHSSGALYFTDPPYGLVKNMDDPAKELDFQGVYRVSPNGELSVLIKDLTFPNGICFSPDEKKLYIAVSDPKRAIYMVYDVLPNGTVANGKVFFDATKWYEEKKLGLPDGIKCDVNGNLWATGPGGGLYIFSPDGTLLGAIKTGAATANLNWGDDGSTLYICAHMGMLRVKTSTKGKGF
ncbi:MAG TPA: SMP-30/gluconolactonase/LRE family protein [Planctomycetota bacterium]|nr:SMP-30/gluconolactonase/LRE family protein [Planctomycetota bacterium]